MDITFSYPTWYIIGPLLAGLVYAALLYFRDRSFQERSPKLNIWLGLLRFLAVFGIGLLLLAPLLKSLITETKKPIVVVAQDVSQSVGSGLGKDSTAFKTKMQQLIASLGEKYEVASYIFDGKMKASDTVKYTGKVTNLSHTFDEIYNLYDGQNLGAVVLASDGIYNEGSNPVYGAATKLTGPIYTIALGDTTQQKDIVLKRLFHNQITYLNDQFAVQIDVQARNLAGNTAAISIAKIDGGKANTIKTLSVPINKNDFFQTVELTLDAKTPGVQRYRVSIAPISGEQSTANNTKELFIDVLDARQKIILLAAAPHPDIAAFKQALELNKNYQLTIAYANDIKVNVSDFDFAILHQLPSANNDLSAVLNQLNSKRIPRMFVVGGQTNVNRFNNVQKVLNILPQGNTANEVQGKLVTPFNLFTLTDAVIGEIPKFPPVQAPFGAYKVVGNATVMLKQRIGKVDTEYPLVVLGEQDGIKTGVMAAEGWWKWRLFDYLQHNNHDLFNELMAKNIQYLAVKEDKRRFRVAASKNVFKENDAIVLDAELYNESYELINTPDVTVVIQDDQGKQYNFAFNKTSKAYSLNAGVLPVGAYTYKAATSYNGQALTHQGQFSVAPVQLELYESTADHSVLQALSNLQGGAMLFPNQLASLPQMLEEKGTVKPVLYQTSRTQSIINFRWLFALLAFLLALEWFIRRYFGGY